MRIRHHEFQENKMNQDLDPDQNASINPAGAPTILNPPKGLGGFLLDHDNKKHERTICQSRFPIRKFQQ